MTQIIESGNVRGPASSTDNAITRFDGTTGRLIQNSSVTISDVGATTLATTDNTTPLYIANSPATGAESLGNEILFKPGGLGGTNIWGYGIISWYAEDYTRKDCILQVHRANYLDDTTASHRHFSIYTSNAARSSVVKRLNIPYMYDTAPITFQNSTVEIQTNITSGSGLFVNHNGSSAGTAILAQLTNGPTNPSTGSVLNISQYGVGAAIGITHQNPTTQTSASVDIVGKFGYKHTLNATGGYGLFLSTNGTATVSSSNGLARFQNTTTADTSPVVNIDNRSAGKSLFINNNGTEKFSVDKDGNVLAAGDITVPDEAYGSGWNGSLEVPTKNAVYDKIQTLLGSTAYTPTNVTTDRSYDANSTSIDEIADVLGTLIADLQSKGIIS
jgi:hypothetical protein